MELDSGEICGGGGDFAKVDDFVAAGGEADSVHVGFVGFECCDDAEVGGDAIVRLVGVGNEVHGVGAGGGVGKAALSESSDFEGGTVLPFGCIGSAKKGGVFENGAGGGVDDREGVVMDGGGSGVGNRFADGVDGVFVGVDVERCVGGDVGGGDNAVGSVAGETPGCGAGGMCVGWVDGDGGSRLRGRDGYSRLWWKSGGSRGWWWRDDGSGCLGCEFGGFALLAAALAGVASGVGVGESVGLHPWKWCRGSWWRVNGNGCHPWKWSDVGCRSWGWSWIGW